MVSFAKMRGLEAMEMAVRQFGEYVGRTASGAAGNENEADEKHRRKLEKPGKAQGDQRKEYQLSGQRHGDGPGMAEDPSEILEAERQSEVEYQQGQDGKDDPDRVHRSLS